MRAPVTVVTATIPGREKLLGECLASVFAQTIEVQAHLINAQSTTEGFYGPSHCAIQQNLLLESVQTPWMMRLADDDMLLPHHIETLLPYLEQADVIYSFADNRPKINTNDWTQEEIINYLLDKNFIDGSAVITRMDPVIAVGGWPVAIESDGEGSIRFPGQGRAVCEDWAMFYNLAAAGAKFLCVPEVTWFYRIGTHNRISSSGWKYENGRWAEIPVRF
jgi:hypothetical protein